MSELDMEKLEALAGKVIGDVAGALSLYMAYLGDQTGLFDAMDKAGPCTIDQLAEKTGLNPKYLHEWLGSVSAAGSRKRIIQPVRRAGACPRAGGPARLHARVHHGGGLAIRGE